MTSIEGRPDFDRCIKVRLRRIYLLRLCLKLRNVYFTVSFRLGSSLRLRLRCGARRFAPSQCRSSLRCGALRSVAVSCSAQPHVCANAYINSDVILYSVNYVQNYITINNVRLRVRDEKQDMRLLHKHLTILCYEGNAIRINEHTLTKLRLVS